MALKDKWKNAGKNIGGAFGNFGKALQTTAKVALGTESDGEDGKAALKKSWKKTGKGFGEAGKSIGKAAQGTAQKVVGVEEEEKESGAAKADEATVIDAEVEETKTDGSGASE